jgi:hypothetical protein
MLGDSEKSFKQGNLRQVRIFFQKSLAQFLSVDSAGHDQIGQHHLDFGLVLFPNFNGFEAIEAACRDVFCCNLA